MKNKGYLFGLGAVAIWTGFILVSRQGGLGPLNANDVIAIRYFTCSVILLPFWFFYQRFNFMQWKFVVAALIGGGQKSGRRFLNAGVLGTLSSGRRHVSARPHQTRDKTRGLHRRSWFFQHSILPIIHGPTFRHYARIVRS